MSTHPKLSSLTQRREEVERELADLAVAKDTSANTALGELERVLMAELGKIDAQIQQIQSYMSQVQRDSDTAA